MFQTVDQALRHSPVLATSQFCLFAPGLYLPNPQNGLFIRLILAFGLDCCLDKILPWVTLSPPSKHFDQSLAHTGQYFAEFTWCLCLCHLHDLHLVVMFSSKLLLTEIDSKGKWLIEGRKSSLRIKLNRKMPKYNIKIVRDFSW